MQMCSLHARDLVLSASSNAAEVGVVGRHLDGGSWERWSLDDSARAECPLTNDYVDTFPMGVAVDFSSQDRIPLGIYSMFLSTFLGMGPKPFRLVFFHFIQINRKIPSFKLIAS